MAPRIIPGPAPVLDPPAEIVAAFGEPSERSASLMVYGPLRLRLEGGSLAGVESQASP